MEELDLVFVIWFWPILQENNHGQKPLSFDEISEKRVGDSMRRFVQMMRIAVKTYTFNRVFS